MEDGEEEGKFIDSEKRKGSGVGPRVGTLNAGMGWKKKIWISLSSTDQMEGSLKLFYCGEDMLMDSVRKVE